MPLPSQLISRRICSPQPVPNYETALFKLSVKTCLNDWLRATSPPRRRVQRSDRAWHRQGLAPRKVVVQFQTAVHVSLKNQVATGGRTTISC